MNKEKKGNVIVTGCCGHIGKAICKKLIELNYRVYGIDLPKAFEEETFIRSEVSEKISRMPYDISRSETFKEIRKELLHVSSIIGLINNAAYYGKVEGFDATFENESYEAWEEVFKVNMYAPFFLAQVLRDKLDNTESKSSIINIGTMYTKAGPNQTLYQGTEMTNPCSYSSSKAGLEGMTRWMSTVLAPKIRVNMISPGGIERGQPMEFQKRYLKRVPMKCFCTEQEIANSVGFLLSLESGCITGQNIVIDGGYTSW